MLIRRLLAALQSHHLHVSTLKLIKLGIFFKGNLHDEVAALRRLFLARGDINVKYWTFDVVVIAVSIRNDDGLSLLLRTVFDWFSIHRCNYGNGLRG